MARIPNGLAPAVLSTLLLAAGLAWAGSALSAPCDLAPLLKSETLDIRVQPLDEGVLLQSDGRSPGIRGVLWAGVLPDGSLATTQWVSGPPTHPERRAIEEGLQRVVGRLGDASIRAGCPALAVQAFDPEATNQRLRRASEGVRREGGGATGGGQDRGGTPIRERVIPYLVLGVEALYGLLLLLAAASFVRREPRTAALLVLTVAGALAVRFFSAPRLPMVAATADMTLLRLPMTWALEGGFQWAGAAQPPGYAVLLSLVLRVFGASFDAAFATTTVIGALTAIPIHRVATRLSGSASTGMLAAIAWAGTPMAVIFANGVNLETPAAFVLVAGFQHFLAWLDERRPADALLYVLAMVTLIHLRPEASFHAVLLVVAQGTLAVAAGRIGARIRSGVILGIALLGAVLVVPYVSALLSWDRGHFDEAIGIALRNMGMGCVAIPLAALLGLIGWRAADGSMTGRRVVFGMVVALMAYRLIAIAWAEGAGMLAPSFPERLLPRGIWDTGDYLRVYAPTHRIPIEDPRMFPPVFLVLWFLALLPLRGARQDTLGEIAPAVLAALAVALQFLGLAGSGENIGDAVRHHVPAAGLAVVSVALGASRLPALLAGRGFRPSAAWVLAAACVASPILSHHAVITDVDFNEQRRFRFLVDSLDLIPADALVLLADHAVPPEAVGVLQGVEPVMRTSRTDQLFALLPALYGRPRAIEGFNAWRGSSGSSAGPVVFFHDLDCYRTVDGYESRECRAVRTLPGIRVLATTRFRNRPYSRFPGIEEDDLEVSLIELPPGARAALREHLVDPALGGD